MDEAEEWAWKYILRHKITTKSIKNDKQMPILLILL